MNNNTFKDLIIVDRLSLKFLPNIKVFSKYQSFHQISKFSPNIKVLANIRVFAEYQSFHVKNDSVHMFTYLNFCRFEICIFKLQQFESNLISPQYC